MFYFTIKSEIPFCLVHYPEPTVTFKSDIAKKLSDRGIGDKKKEKMIPETISRNDFS